MMGRQTGDQSQLFYLFNLEGRMPTGHLLRRFNLVVSRVLADLREKLEPFYSDIGRPSIGGSIVEHMRRRPSREELPPHPRYRSPPGPVATLGQLHKHSSWTWVWCERCQHHAPMAFVPLMIRWGSDASSDVLRRSARCSRCGMKGATLQHPSWMGSEVGFQPFPAKP